MRMEADSLEFSKKTKRADTVTVEVVSGDGCQEGSERKSEKEYKDEGEDDEYRSFSQLLRRFFGTVTFRRSSAT